MQINPLGRFTGHKGSIYCIEPATSSAFYTAGSEGIIAVWQLDEPDNGDLMARVPGVVYSLLSVNEELLLAGTAHGKIHIIDVKEKKEIRLLQYHQCPIFRMAYWSQKQRFFSLDAEGNVQVYDQQFNPIHYFKAAEGKLRSIAFSDDAFILGAADGRILRYNDEYQLQQSYTAHKEGFGVNALWLSTSGLLSGSRDAHLVYSDPLSGEILRAIPAHNYAIYRIAAAPGKPELFATASRDKTIKLWLLDNEIPLQRLDAECGGHLNSVNDLCWLNSSVLVTVSDDRTAIAWKVED